MKTLVLGGTRSGKSRLAEQLASQSKLEVTYIATANTQYNDLSMQQRITLHQQRRPAHWQTIEESVALAATIAAVNDNQRLLLIDCLTLWLTNLLLLQNEQKMMTEIEALYQLVRCSEQPLIFVANESNLGITPVDALSRKYCDIAGTVHQQLASECDTVIFTVAGLPHYLKGTPT